MQVVQTNHTHPLFLIVYINTTWFSDAMYWISRQDQKATYITNSHKSYFVEFHFVLDTAVKESEGRLWVRWQVKQIMAQPQAPGYGEIFDAI